jgi:long-chain acyl-CoA synthetase
MPSDGRFIVCPKINEFYEGRIEQLMQAVSQPERVKKFLVLASPFKLESDELTATMKVRRRHVVQNYLQELSALYESEATVEADRDAG